MHILFIIFTKIFYIFFKQKIYKNVHINLQSIAKVTKVYTFENIEDYLCYIINISV